MKKGQMFIVTMVFLVGLISTIQQTLFVYSSVDLSDTFRNSDFYILSNLRDSARDLIRSTDNCAFNASNSLEYNAQEFSAYINSRRPREGFSTRIYTNTSCEDWENPETGIVFNVSYEISGRNIETGGKLSFPRLLGGRTFGGGGGQDYVCGSGHTDNGDGTCTATFDNPTEDGYIRFIQTGTVWQRKTEDSDIQIGASQPPEYARGYAEWDISSIPSYGTITKIEFLYEGMAELAADASSIYSMEIQPSILPDNQGDGEENEQIYSDTANGTAYLLDNDRFPELGPADVGGTGPAWTTTPVADLQAAVGSSRSWFALGFVTNETSSDEGVFYTEEGSGNPPTLRTTYSLPS